MFRLGRRLLAEEYRQVSAQVADAGRLKIEAVTEKDRVLSDFVRVEVHACAILWRIGQCQIEQRVSSRPDTPPLLGLPRQTIEVAIARDCAYLQHQCSRQKQEASLLQQQVTWLETQLREKSDDLLSVRRDTVSSACFYCGAGARRHS